MKNINTSILFSTFFFIFSCGNDQKKELTPKATPVNHIKPVDEIKTTPHKNVKIHNLPVKISSKKSLNQPEKNHDSIVKTNHGAKSSDMLHNFFAIRKILANCKIGETFTQKELSQNLEIPKDAIKLIKSITKTSEDEIEIKWKSTWFIEKVSDAKFTDAKMKIKFQANKMYTSGKAIGIKYNKKIYNDLIIVGTKAYIPSVKGYHWKIGK
ncbi:hypothetical protein [Flavobacterium ustbae]|uniref:hypothetical protein n=1 Tax=Flavobacterium ustbae TaxID=2488790 RepID=UPI000F77F369|nr:hypothetical protein [Flavobacterium ustbae]